MRESIEENVMTSAEEFVPKVQKKRRLGYLIRLKKMAKLIREDS